MRFTQYLMGSFLLRDKAAGGDGGGGGGDAAKDLATLKEQNAALLARLDALEKKGAATPNPDPEKDKDKLTLAEKAEAERKAKEKSSADSKVLEAALKFDITSAEWVKTNALLLPKNVAGLFEQAAKENYGSAIEKANAIKVGIVSEFFAVQSNLDLLTETQKNSLAEFKALTKADKQERVQAVYDGIFEPTFEALKKIKRAEQKGNDEVDPSNAKATYAKRMADLSKAKFIKKGAK